jgi:hypothetical protein
MTPFDRGYYAGMGNDYDNPYPLGSINYWQWSNGNYMGENVYRSTVEWVCLNMAQD